MINIFTSVNPSVSTEPGDISGVSPFLTPRAIAIYLVIFATAILVLAINFMITESKKEKRIAKEESEARKAPFVRRDKHKEVIQIVTKFPDNPSIAPIVAANPALVTSLKNSGAQIPVSDIRQLSDSDEVSSDADNSGSEEGKKDMHRFQKLSKIDTIYPGVNQLKLPVTPELTLPYICWRFRAFCANQTGNKLYYSIGDIRRFITSLGVSKTLILQGMSGTGKTSLPLAFGRFIKNTTSVIPVQPMWKEKSDLLGYYNEFTDRFNESTILEKIYEANKINKLFIIILDEMNIARVEYYFSEFLSLLEIKNDKERNLEVTTLVSEQDPELFNKGAVHIPNNIWFIGTANNDDSTFAISDKVYDRAMIMNLDKRSDSFTADADNEAIDFTWDKFSELIEQAKQEYAITRRERKHIQEFDAYIQETFGITFGNRIKMQMDAYVPIYIACGGKEIEAIDDILAKKVLRKLESQNPVYVKNHSEELISKLNEIFGLDQMPVSEEYIRKLAKNA